MRPRVGTFDFDGVRVTVDDRSAFGLATDRSPGAAQRLFSETQASAAALGAERIDQVTELLDDVHLPITEERISLYAGLQEATFAEVAAHLRDAYRRARQPLQVDAERRAARERGNA